jgi:hypothetical protein
MTTFFISREFFERWCRQVAAARMKHFLVGGPLVTAYNPRAYTFRDITAEVWAMAERDAVPGRLLQ